MEQNEFERIARSVRGRVFGACLSFGLTAEDAEDIAQDTLIRLWTMRDDIGKYRSPEALALSVARHLCIDRTRRKRTEGLERRVIIDERHPSPDKQLEETDNDAWLAERMRRLPPSEYQILRLRQVEHKSNQDIAAILGIEVSSVATILSRARHKLLQDIKRHCL